MISQFIQQFLQYDAPIPNCSVYTFQEVKRDLKLLLQLATVSQLNRKTEKDGRILFFCKKSGKECFCITVNEIQQQEAKKCQSQNKQPLFKIKDDFYDLRHSQNCQYRGQQAIYYKTYCLLQLKKDIIQDFMIKKRLMKKEPAEILYLFSYYGSSIGSQQKQKPKYFFQRFIKGNQYRKSLKKKFDNIVNIDIKAKQKRKKVKIQQPSFEQSEHLNYGLDQTPKVNRTGQNKQNILSQCTKVKTQYKQENNVVLLKFQPSLKQMKKQNDPSDIFFQEDQPQRHQGRAFDYASNEHFPFNFSEIYDVKKEQKHQGWFEELHLKQAKNKNHRHKSSIGIDSFENPFAISRQHFDMESNKWDSLANLIDQFQQNKELN